MSKDSITALQPAGLALFADAETFLVDLSEDAESMITGGANSISNSGVSLAVRRRRRQLAIRRRRLLLARRRRQLLLRRRRIILARRRAAAGSSNSLSLT